MMNTPSTIPGDERSVNSRIEESLDTIRPALQMDGGDVELWSRLERRQGGNTGKGATISALLARGQNLSGVDFSCRARGIWDDAENRCEVQPALTNVSIPINSEIYGWNITKSHLQFSELSNSRLDRFSASDTYIDIRGRNMEVHGELAITHSDVTGLKIKGHFGSSIAIQGFAWGDSPPIVLSWSSAGMEQPIIPDFDVILCDPAYRDVLPNNRPLIIDFASVPFGELPVARCISISQEDAKARYPHGWGGFPLGQIF
jgi:hypothetical protein